MGGSSETSEDETTAVSHSWADTIPPDSPPIQRRKTFSHYTQVRHNGYLTKCFKLAGADNKSWSRQFCTVHGNILRCFAGKRQFTDHEDPVETNIIRAVRPWEAEFSKPYNRGLLIDCEGGETIIARTDTSAEQEEWTEALGTVTDLLGNSSGAGGGAGEAGAGYDSDDDSADGEGGGMQTTYLAQKDELLSGAEATGACIVVFQVAKTTLRRVDDVDMGRFNNGDVYLVMHADYDISGDAGAATGGITRTLFYWVGSKASMDKGTVACIKAVELRRALPGPCSIRREDEGQESPEFLVLFDKVTVAEDESGARVLSKVKKWNEQPPIMYSVRVRTSAAEVDGNPRPEPRYHRPPLHSSFTVGRVDLDEDQLGSERVLLVDDRNGHVYLWFGTMSTFKHRGFGLEAATRLKADSPKGGQVVQVDEDDEPPELRRILDRARKQRLLELQVRAAEGAENGAEEEGAEQRRMSLMGASAEGAGPAVSLFRVTQAEGGLQLSLVACTSREYIREIGGDELEPEQDGSPMLSMLEGDAAFILDVFTEVFVWIGDDADRTARIGASKVAHQLVHAVARPPWAEDITHVREDREPFLFRVKFFDWGVPRRRRGGGARETGPKNCMTAFHKAIRTIAEVRHDPESELEVKSTAILLGGMEADLPHPGDAEVEAAGAGVDEGFGELLMWRVHPRGLVSVPEEEFGHVQSTHSYVFLYGYDASGDRDANEDDIGEEEEEDQEEGRGGGDSSSDDDSLLSGLDGREGMSDDDDDDDDGDDSDVEEDDEPASEDGRRAAAGAKSMSAAAHRTNGREGGTTPPGKKGAAAGGGGGGTGADSSKRKTMFAEMKRESMAGSLQPAATKDGGGRRRRPRRLSSGESADEDLERMEVPMEEEEEDDDDEDSDSDGVSKKSRSSKGGSSRRARANGNGEDSDEDDVSDVSVTSDEEDGSRDGGNDDGRSEGGSSGGGDGAEPRFLIYFWAGTRAKKSDWVLWKLELAKTMIPEWQKVINAEIPQVQVPQGQEPLHFRRLFGQGRDHGRLIVHDRVWRKRDNPEKRVSLFKVQRMPAGEFQAFQVPPSVGSLNSMDVFVCICTVVTDDWVGNNDEAVFFWVGTYATLELQEHGAKVLMALMEYYCMPADFNVSILEEDELYDDHAHLWDELSEMLGGEMTWANWKDVFDEDEFDADEDLGCVPKLYVADSGTGNVVLTYVGHVQRSSLVSETVAVLDTVEGVYVWRGIKSDSFQYNLISRACEEYCLHKPLPVGRKVIKVREGHEPLAFRARFQAWDDGGPGDVKKFQDIYEQRVVQMSKEGTLGDMTALRGRVLDDEEAAKYWDDRGAEPGGQGVRAGMFRDDPASRSTLRRGAPGRKAWVKPPPKPVVVDRTKELDAKRNFLALKDRFEGGGADWDNKPKSRSFSRRSLLEARQESIALGHSTKFQEASKRNSNSNNQTGRLSAGTRRSNGRLDQDDFPGPQEAAAAGAAGVEVDAQAFLSRHSWGSASSARRRHSAAMEAEAAADRVRKSLENAAAATAPAPRPSWSRRASGSRGSFDSTAGPTSVAGRKLSLDSAASASGRASLDSAAGSPVDRDAAAASKTGALTHAPLTRSAIGGGAAGGGGGGAATGGWVRRESGSLSPPPPRGAGGAAPAERGGRAVGRWVRRGGNRDSPLSVSPVVPPSRKPPAGPAGAAAAERGSSNGFPGGRRASSGAGKRGASLESTTAEIGGGGERGGSAASAAGLAAAAERERAEAEAAFAGDTEDKGGAAASRMEGTVKPSTSPVLSSSQTKQEVIQARWVEGPRAGGARDSFEAGAMPRRAAAAGAAAAAAAAASGVRPSTWRPRSRSGSVVDNEGLQEALEQAQQEERRRSSVNVGNNSRNSAPGRPSWARSSTGTEGGDSGGTRGTAKVRNGRSGRTGSGSSGGGGAPVAPRSSGEKAAAAYSLALARVRRETVQEGLRKKGGKEPSETAQPEEEGKAEKPTVVSIKHAMSRVRAGGNGGAAAGASSSAGENRVADGSRLKAALRASIESRISSHDGAGDLDGDDDGEEDGEDDDDDADEDLDSPRNRGRQYDDRWKMPGHAESVLASFVERLEHRGQAVDHDGGGANGSGGGGAAAAAASGDNSASAALAEARANRGAAVAVLRRGHRLHSERAAKNSPGPSSILAESAGKKRRSAGGSKARNGSRSRGKEKRESAGKRRAAREADQKRVGPPSIPASASGSSGAWSKIGSMALSSIQRAAEVIVGVSKEDSDDEQQQQEQQHQQYRAAVERTGSAATAFLSTSSRSRAADDDQE